MICKNLMMKTFLVGPVLGATLFAVIVVGCTGDAGHGDGRDSDRATVSQGISEREGGDSGGEHGGRREGTESKEEGGEGSGEHGSGGDGGGERVGKPPCRAQSFLSDSRGAVASADWLFPCSTMKQPGLSTERYETRSHRNYATCRPNPT